MKTALITGAGSGFGLVTALELVKSGYHVIATMRTIHSQQTLIDKAAELKLTNRITILEMDVTNEKHIEQVTQYMKQNCLKLDLLVNNAGYSHGGFVSDLSTEAFEQQLNVNLHGVFRVTIAMLPFLEQADKANIINISSVSGMIGFPGLSSYCTSKFALEGFSESLRLELLQRNIYVSIIEPSSYQTAIWQKSLQTIDQERMQADPLKYSVFNYAKQSANTDQNPKEIADLIIKICNRSKPKLRYPIGKGAAAMFFAKRLLPWQLLEKIILKTLQK
ncbi:SDR family oxidoreductase [Gracilibacillus caseinilyticus]|uniref:SDR family oxidoreductase n=1 Tax=Gracilibacillus caseinilyticus TaxID=2932256 RepID=A0ABY4EX61_9BACI|nr:SDR family oxidoreductase [Gracilibacillus caseinilyticus]UOQ48545.1 SDR family oxidoreductase [Gracilibacillus caseinilyticus]